MRAGQNQRVHGAGHAHVAEAALLLQLVGIVEGARVGKEALFQAGQKDQRKLQPLGGVQRHQRNAGLGIELIRIGGQGGVVQELGQRLAAGFGVVGGVGQLLQVLNAAEGLRRAFGLQGLDVAGAVDEEADQLRKRRCIAWSPKALNPIFFFRRHFYRVRFEIGLGRGWNPSSQRRGLGRL